MTVDLLLRYLIITIAVHIACAWIQTFQSAWPLVEAFELANTAEEQLFKSLGVRFDGLTIIPTLFNLIISGRARRCELHRFYIKSYLIWGHLGKSGSYENGKSKSWYSAYHLSFILKKASSFDNLTTIYYEALPCHECRCVRCKE